MQSEEVKSYRSIYIVDCYNDKVELGHSSWNSEEDPRYRLSLVLSNNGHTSKQDRPQTLSRHSAYSQLDQLLMRLAHQGKLGRTTFFMGVNSDPFHPFEGKFDLSMRLLELFCRYTPGLIYIQTRSPLLVIGMPALKRLKSNLMIGIGLETIKDEIVRKFTDGFPLIEERLKMARTLRHFGLNITLTVSPLLPYGDWRKDAERFARVLVDNSDKIVLRPFYEVMGHSLVTMRRNQIVSRISAARQFAWLRADADRPLKASINAMSPDKLTQPTWEHLIDRQLSLDTYFEHCQKKSA